MVGRPAQLGSMWRQTADIKYAKQRTTIFVYRATPIFLINGIPPNQPRPPYCLQYNMATILRTLSVTVLLADVSLGKLLLPVWKDQAVQDDYDVLKYPPARPPGFGFWTKNGVVKSTGRAYTAHVAVLSGGFPNTFSLQLPTAGTVV